MTRKIGKHLVCLAPDGVEGGEDGPIEYDFQVGEAEVVAPQVDPKVAALEAELATLKGQMGLSKEERDRQAELVRTLGQVGSGLERIPQQKPEAPPVRKSWAEQKREFGLKVLEDPEAAAEALRESIRGDLVAELAPVLTGMNEELLDLRTRAQDGDVRKNPAGNFIMDKYGDEVKALAKTLGGRDGLQRAVQQVTFNHMDEYVDAKIAAKAAEVGGQQAGGVGARPAGSAPVGGSAPVVNGAGKKTMVRLTPAEAADADLKGLSYENYARYVLKKI